MLVRGVGLVNCKSMVVTFLGSCTRCVVGVDTGGGVWAGLVLHKKEICSFDKSIAIMGLGYA